MTKSEVKLLEGRYGPYVSDGTTNASLPKQQAIEQVTLDQALELLAARAAADPSPARARRAKPAAKKAAKGQAGSRRRWRRSRKAREESR